MKPIIEISCGLKENRLIIKEDYSSVIIKNGGIPVLIPVICEQSSLVHYINYIDSLFLPGGGDIDPKFYHEQPKYLKKSIFIRLF